MHVPHTSTLLHHNACHITTQKCYTHPEGITPVPCCVCATTGKVCFFFFVSGEKGATQLGQVRLGLLLRGTSIAYTFPIRDGRVTFRVQNKQK